MSAVLHRGGSEGAQCSLRVRYTSEVSGRTEAVFSEASCYGPLLTYNGPWWVLLIYKTDQCNACTVCSCPANHCMRRLNVTTDLYSDVL